MNRRSFFKSLGALLGGVVVGSKLPEGAEAVDDSFVIDYEPIEWWGVEEATEFQGLDPWIEPGWAPGPQTYVEYLETLELDDLKVSSDFSGDEYE